jgi:hypothetical protein
MKLFNDRAYGLGSRILLFVTIGTVLACSDFGAVHFRDEVDKVNQANVAARYGPPHQVEKRQDGRIVWTYFERGSGTAGYSGYARSQYCRAYMLTFDENEILREWQEQDCSTHPAKVTGPFSDHK